MDKKTKQMNDHLKWAQNNPLLMAQRIRENQTFDLIAQRLEMVYKSPKINTQVKHETVRSIIQEYYNLIKYIEKFQQTLVDS